MAASSDRAPADQTGGDRVSMASAGVPDVRRDHTRALACRRSQRDLRPSRASDGATVQVMKRGITLPFAPPDRLREAETVPLHPAGRLHTLRRGTPRRCAAVAAMW